jgi:hypothetical protein
MMSLGYIIGDVNFGFPVGEIGIAIGGLIGASLFLLSVRIAERDWKKRFRRFSPKVQGLGTTFDLFKLRVPLSGTEYSKPSFMQHSLSERRGKTILGDRMIFCIETGGGEKRLLSSPYRNTVIKIREDHDGVPLVNFVWKDPPVFTVLPDEVDLQWVLDNMLDRMEFIGRAEHCSFLPLRK